MVEISKADWKLFRECIGDWQERYMEKLSKEYVKLLSSPGNASDHFWELEKRIKQDRKHPGVLLEMNKGEAIWDIAILVKKKVITMDDLEGFVKKLEESDFEIEFVNKLMTHSWGQKVVRFYDPDGNLIEVGTPVN